MSKLAKIITSHICPPVPSRQFDWSATEDGHEPGDAVGYGATEDAAIADLRMQLLEAEAIRAERERERERFEAEAERDMKQAIRIGKQQAAFFNSIFGSAK